MFTGYLATLNTAALMPEALMASVFLPDLYTTLPVERTETAFATNRADVERGCLGTRIHDNNILLITQSALIYHRIFLTFGSGASNRPHCQEPG